jgi:Flp pilus assembly protein TadG
VSADRPGLAHDIRGTTAVEFALVLPVLIVMVLSALQFGWAQNAAGAVGYALQKAARSLVLNPSLDQAAIQTLVRSHLDSETAAKVTVTLTKTPGAGGATIARVTGVYTSEIGLPTLAALPFQSTRVVVTPLP